MIQITGLTKVYRRGGPPAVLDLTFDARPGTVTVLLGPEESGKSTALRLMLELERGRGVTLFGGRTYRRLRRPEHEVGVVLAAPGGGAPGAADCAGHPDRKARGHLRMLAAAVGMPVGRADELLEQTRLAAVADQRLRTFSPGMHRRLALAAALLGEPASLLLDAPAEGLSPRNAEWFHSFLRSFAIAGGTVLATTRSPQEAARLADRVITLDEGRMAADQPVSEFRRTRISPEVAVRGPQMARLADLLTGHGAQVRKDGGAGLAVAGIGRTEIGELAYRNGILLHELADRVVERPAPRAALPTGSGRSGRLQVQAGSGPARPPKEQAEAVPERPAPPASAGRPATGPEAGETAAAGRTAVLPVVQPPVVGGRTTAVPDQSASGPDRDPGHDPGREQDRGRDRDPAPTLALPVAAAAGLSAATALSALTARSGVRSVFRRRTAARPSGEGPAGGSRAGSGSGQREEKASPTVAVDRLFRDVPGDPARASAAPGASPAPPRGAARRPGDAADLLTDDTVRLGRVVQPGPAQEAPARPSAPAARSAASGKGAPSVPVPAGAAPAGAAAGPPGEPGPAGSAGPDRGGVVLPVTSDLRSE
ncbi:ATP-binding cassette domain-containing protein [Kitasatospora sp. NPDC056327]|uniref:ATP-binding cassette domain-containing protein n=1 Tax=Kitasatospora sp. NPDC056327 TaxID=3345785 RepID=UPI0035DB90F7